MPKSRFRTLEFTIPQDAWSGPTDPADGRLTCDVRINGVSFWVEAVPVKVNGKGIQVGVDDVSESRLVGLSVEFDAPGFQTLVIRGREYVVHLTPFGR